MGGTDGKSRGGSGKKTASSLRTDGTSRESGGAVALKPDEQHRKSSSARMSAPRTPSSAPRMNPASSAGKSGHPPRPYSNNTSNTGQKKPSAPVTGAPNPASKKRAKALNKGNPMSGGAREDK